MSDRMIIKWALRVLFVVGAFYVPGLMLLLGSWVLGYSLEESRDVIGLMGAFMGIPAAGAAVVVLLEMNGTND